jgi:hypothetical protein
MQTYKYFIDIKWFPITEPESVRYNIIKSPVRKPEIVAIVPGFGGKIFEVSDVFLFYCDTQSNEYEYAVYKFDNLRIVKYRPAGDGPFRFCIKSTDLKFNLSANLLTRLTGHNTNIAASIKPFNSYKFYEIENPVFVEHRYEHCCDVITDKGVLMLSLGETNTFISIGNASVNFKAKGCVQFSKSMINISLFDIYTVGDTILEPVYLERRPHLEQILSEIKSNPNVKISAADIINQNECNQHTMLLIIGGSEITYMSWSRSPYIYAQLKSTSVVLADGIIEEFFNVPAINPETIKLNADKSYELIYDRLVLDKFSLYKSYQNREILDPEFLLKTNPKYRTNTDKRALIKKYASGNTLIVSDYISPMYDVEYTEIKSLPSDEKELSALCTKYHTIILDGSPDDAPDNLKQAYFEQPNNKVLVLPSGEFKDAGQKTFVFLLGCIGSGKSALIKKVRASLNMSGGIFIAQIDSLIEKDIMYITDPCEETYLKLRKAKYNEHLDHLIGSHMLALDSIILETTHVDNNYVAWLKTYGYHIVVALVNESYENITQNIRIRNLTKIRKTSLSLEKYEEFQKNIPTYVSCADKILELSK